MTIRSTPNNGGFQLSDVPFFSYYLFCLIKSSFIMTLRLRYQTFKNKLKHTGISSDIINRRSMGNLACTSRLFGKERARLWRYGRFQWCALGLHSPYFHLKSRPCELFYFVDFLSLSRACAWCLVFHHKRTTPCMGWYGIQTKEMWRHVFIFEWRKLNFDVDSLKRSLNSSDEWWTHFRRNTWVLSFIYIESLHGWVIIYFVISINAS